ncbi:MAG: hypothetical protein HY544_05080 [Candidatus Diapherotrites archaeon]|uniref:Uncharacterized protein n=1 Tax=Candidatus Iainarchaeum sp. TaxID=3101447 RepID=A0A8T3YQ27_9ARCH|nr:hypothetical protein [Candidatus Diapherotrites archaeon]
MKVRRQRPATIKLNGPISDFTSDYRGGYLMQSGNMWKAAHGHFTRNPSRKSVILRSDRLSGIERRLHVMKKGKGLYWVKRTHTITTHPEPPAPRKTGHRSLDASIRPPLQKAMPVDNMDRRTRIILSSLLASRRPKRPGKK